MSDREFDNYLTLVAGLLRLDGRQRQQIAAELRAHLEDRLDELIAQGVPHEEAVQRALAEFGDAAGLAASFSIATRGRNRRWLMRVTTFSIAATILIAAGVFTFWPGRNAAPGVAAAVAQVADPFAQPADRPPKQPGATAAALTSAAALEAKLNQPTTVDFNEVSLQDAIAYLKDTHQIPLIIKTKKLDEAGVSIDTPVTKQLQGIRLSSVLGDLLEDLDLTFVVQDELILITTPEDAQSRLEIRVYDCRDLLAKRGGAVVKPVAGEAAADGGYGGGAPAGLGGYGGGMGGFVSDHDHRAQRLMSIITTNVDDQSWQLATGEMYGGGGGGEEPPKRGRGMISEYDGLLVVTQTAQTHRKIERVLDMLRRAAGLQAVGEARVVR